RGFRRQLARQRQRFFPIDRAVEFQIPKLCVLWKRGQWKQFSSNLIIGQIERAFRNKRRFGTKFQSSHTLSRSALRRSLKTSRNGALIETPRKLCRRQELVAKPKVMHLRRAVSKKRQAGFRGPVPRRSARETAILQIELFKPLGMLKFGCRSQISAQPSQTKAGRTERSRIPRFRNLHIKIGRTLTWNIEAQTGELVTALARRRGAVDSDRPVRFIGRLFVGNQQPCIAQINRISDFARLRRL